MFRICVVIGVMVVLSGCGDIVYDVKVSIGDEEIFRGEGEIKSVDDILKGFEDEEDIAPDEYIIIPKGDFPDKVIQEWVKDAG